MKKLTAILLSVCAAVCLLAFAACGESNDETNNPAEQTVDNNFQICAAYTATSDVMTITETSSLKDYMDALKTAGLIEFTGDDYSYGYYVSSIFGVSGTTAVSTANSWEGYSWMIYTTITTIDGTPYSDTATSIDYNGITFYCSSYGVSYLPCVEGESYAFIYQYITETW